VIGSGKLKTGRYRGRHAGDAVSNHEPLVNKNIFRRVQNKMRVQDAGG
jgi:hypothetical protein